MRADEGFYRKNSISQDGGITWSNPQASNDQIDCKCQGSILSIGQSVFLSNAASATERINMTIKKSSDGGKSWKGNILCMKETLVIRIWLNSLIHRLLLYMKVEKKDIQMDWLLKLSI